MQIHELDTYIGNLSSTDYLAIDDGTETTKLPATTFVDVFYPVGSYYETSDTSFDPNTAWGGTWVKDSAGKVTVAQDTSDTAFDTIGETGGEKTHTLTESELPKIEGSFDIRPWHSGSVDGATQVNPTGVFGRTTGSTQTGVQTSGTNASSFKTTLSFGANGAHNNLQPYIVVNRWHRTA